MCSVFTSARQAGSRFTYPRGMEGWVERWFTCLRAVSLCCIHANVYASFSYLSIYGAAVIFSDFNFVFHMHMHKGSANGMMPSMIQQNSRCLMQRCVSEISTHYLLVVLVMIELRYYVTVFQPFWCRRTLHKREGHSRNPMHWSVSQATNARMKLQSVYGLISLAGHWGQSHDEDDKADKDDQYKIWPY